MNPEAPAHSRPRVLIVEDEPLLRDAMVAFLNLDGCHCQGVESLSALRAWQASEQVTDVVVLDLGLPDGDGLDAIAPLVAQRPNIGVIVVSARGQPAQRIQGLQQGADAYLTKPVELAELSLMLKRLSRRSQQAGAGAWALDASTWRLSSPQGHAVLLTLREKQLLSVLMASAGQAVGRDQLAAALGVDPLGYDYRRMEILVRRLRAKCERQLDTPLPLETVYGQGYVFKGAARVGE